MLAASNRWVLFLPAPATLRGVKIRRDVLLLGFAALLNDASSDMIFPLLPLFLTQTLGATPAILGVIEGAADAVSSVLKYVFGRFSDRFGKRKPFVVGGYALTALARIFIPFATVWQMILASRLLDRTGKGLRTAPRDAMILEVTPPEDRGRAFGFHRAMDHAGAVIGPLIAAGLLWYGLSVRSIFIIALVPGFIATALLLFALRESKKEPVVPAVKALETSSGKLPRTFRSLLIPIGFFALANSSDAFLLLQASRIGIAPAMLPLLWAAHHLVKVLLSTRAGGFSDRGHRIGVIVTGWLLYGLIYLAFPFAASPWVFTMLLVAYALPFALTEGAERALIGSLLPSAMRGRGFGMYALVTGAGTFAGTLLFGLFYEVVAPIFAFHAAAGLSLVAAITLFAMHEKLTPAEG